MIFIWKKAVNPEVPAVCVVTEQGDSVLEIKNLAVSPEAWQKGLGKQMVEAIIALYQDQYETLLVGTGDNPLTNPFYEKCGFQKAYVIPDFFTKHYDHPIYEAGVQLKDMIYLKRKMR